MGTKVKAEQVETIAPEISVKDTNGIEQFKITNEIGYEGFEFDPGSKKVIAKKNIPFTCYIDTINGDDLSAEVGNPLKPFKTDKAAYNVVENRKDTLILEFICDASSRSLSNIPYNVEIRSNSSGSFIFENIDGASELSTGNIFVFNAPRATLTFAGAVSTGFRLSLITINCDVININCSQSGYSGFFGSNASDARGFINCREFNINSACRLINYQGDFTCKYLNINSSGFAWANHNQYPVIKLRVYELTVNTGGYSGSLLGGSDHSISVFSGTGNIVDNSNKYLDLATKKFNNVNYRYSGTGAVTGVMPDLNFTAQDWTQYFVNFVGRISRANGNSSGLILRNSTIFLAAELQTLYGHINLSGKEFIFQNVTIIQDTPDVLFKGVDPLEPITIKQYGYITGNFTGFGDNVNVNVIF